jgi:hypothetical protein
MSMAARLFSLVEQGEDVDADGGGAGPGVKDGVGFARMRRGSNPYAPAWVRVGVQDGGAGASQHQREHL